MAAGWWLQAGSWVLTAAALPLGLSVAAAQSAAPQYPVPGGNFGTPAQADSAPLPALPTTKAITPGGSVVEDVIARVNDQIITRSEYERAREGLQHEAEQSNLPPSELAEREHDLLRDMIDQQLLLSRGKQLGITGDAETVRRLDELRKQNHLDSTEALEKAAAAQGVNFEDFRNNIRNNAITQQVVRDEVGRRLQMTHATEETYYAAHRKDFEQPEQVHLSEILITTPDNATDAQLAAAKAKAGEVADKLKAGDSFGDVAKKYSNGPTAAAGGDLGDFKRGALGQVLEDATFSLPVGGVTAPIRTRQGYVILRADSHTPAGVPPLSTVEPQVQEAMYLDQLQPALRAYLTKAREDAYVDIKPGFVDAGSTRAETKPTFTAYVAPSVKKKQLVKQRLEQERDARAQAELAEAKQRSAERAERNAAKGAPKGSKTAGIVLASTTRHKHVRREKIRYGQAPRATLSNVGVATNTPAATGGTNGSAGTGASAAGTAAGNVFGATDTATTVTNGTGGVAEEASVAPEAEKKSRFTDRQRFSAEKTAQAKVTKAEVHTGMHATATPASEAADQRVQAAPLGLASDMSPKALKAKKKRDKDARKERLQQKPVVKPTETVISPPAPTTNPALVATPAGLSHGSVPAAKPSADSTTLPPATAAPASAMPAGQPLPPAVPAQSSPAPQPPQ